jgi:hypothetical protein
MARMSHHELEQRIRRVTAVMKDYRSSEYASGGKIGRYAREIEEALEAYDATHKVRRPDKGPAAEG